MVKFDGKTPEDGKRRYQLERAWVRHKLIRDLATNDATQVELADRYGVVPQSISQFKQRHQTAIDEMRADLENQFAALWIAEKASRLAEYQQDVEDIGSTSNHELLRAKHNALRSAAEELGQLPSRYNVQVNNAPVTYKIDGVDLEQLR